ncbi:MAG TPA: hypothetical protein VGR35_04095 [Tepidisphaeraceae bacterium]|nr:hypothetical protein [Tepidisphaeraceae bacterium]
MRNLELLITIGGVLHLGILIASALVPGALEWKRELEKLRPLSRQLIWVHGAFIVLTIVGFGAISLIAPRELASGTTLARAFCAFVAIFWLCRLGVQLFVFDAAPFLTRRYLKIGYHALTIVFMTLVVIYGYAALASLGR